MERSFYQQLCILLMDLTYRVDMRHLILSSDNPNFIQYSSFVLSILTLVLGLVGNMIVIIITGFFMKTQKSRIWFLNLAIADLMFLLVLPLNAVSVLRANWPYGEHVCKMYNFLSIVNMYASIFLITALTFERFLSVMAPIWHHKFHSLRVCYWTCASIWAVTVLASIPIIVHSYVYEFDGLAICTLYEFDINEFTLYKGEKINFNESPDSAELNVTNEQYLEKIHKTCAMNEPFIRFLGKKFHDMFLTATKQLLIPLLVIGYFIPLCVILCANVAIACKVRTTGTIRSSKLYVLVTVAVMAFFITRTPLVIGQIFLLVCVQSLDLTLLTKITLVSPLLSSIANLNCCLNPIIYVFFGREVKAVFANLFSRMRHRNAMSSATAKVTST